MRLNQHSMYMTELIEAKEGSGMLCIATVQEKLLSLPARKVSDKMQLKPF